MNSSAGRLSNLTSYVSYDDPIELSEEQRIAFTAITGIGYEGFLIGEDFKTKRISDKHMLEILDMLSINFYQIVEVEMN